jgi:hypothetical protein
MHPADLIDLQEALRQLATLPVFDDAVQPVRRGIKLDIGRSQRPSFVSGRAFGRERRLRIVVPHYAHAAEILEVLLHELVHLAMPAASSHGERFRRTLARAASQAWGVEVDPNPPATSDNIRAYALDEHITAALKPLIESGAVVVPTPAPVAKPSRVEATEALVEKRAAHAVKMLTKAERDVKRAKTREQKWRTKVRYYERVAARRAK